MLLEKAKKMLQESILLVVFEEPEAKLALGNAQTRQFLAGQNVLIQLVDLNTPYGLLCTPCIVESVGAWELGVGAKSGEAAILVQWSSSTEARLVHRFTLAAQTAGDNETAQSIASLAQRLAAIQARREAVAAEQ